MKMTKYEIGDEVYIRCRVKSINDLIDVVTLIPMDDLHADRPEVIVHKTNIGESLISVATA